MQSFELPFRVEPSDIDVLGHANNTAYVRWIQDVAVAHSSDVGLDYEAYQRIGAVFVIRRHEVDYLRSLALGDGVVARTWVPIVRAAHCERHTEIRRASDAEVVARGITTWVLISLKTGRPTRIPAEILTAFGVEARVPGITDQAP